MGELSHAPHMCTLRMYQDIYTNIACRLALPNDLPLTCTVLQAVSVSRGVFRGGAGGVALPRFEEKYKLPLKGVALYNRK